MADLLALTTEIVTAHLTRNKTEGERLPTLIRSIYGALAHVSAPNESVRAARPAVPIGHSIFNDHIVCLACGKRFRTLSRHLKTGHQLTFEDYRQRFSLPHDYPMAASEFIAIRSRIARSIGLGHAGRHRRKKT